MRKFIVLIGAVLFLATGCSSGWLGEEEDTDRSNLDKRVPVLKLESSLEADDTVKSTKVTVPPQHNNLGWYQKNDQNIPLYQNLALPKELTKRTGIKAGAGAQSGSRLMALPVVADNMIFILDGDAFVQAYDLNDFKHFLWKAKTLSRDRREGVTGGGFAYAGGVLYVTSGVDEVLALDAKTGEVKWRRQLGGIIRAAPTVSAGKVFALSVDNKMYALDITDGSILWTHEGYAETLGLLGSPSPSVAGNIVIVPYSSGEIYALEAHSGTELWSGNVAFRGADSISSAIPDIEAFPVISRGAVFAGSNSGVLAADSLKQGVRFWEHEMSLSHTPWIAGDFLYVLTEESQLAAVYIPSGKVKWVKSLAAYEDEEKKHNKISWSSPIMAGDYLRIVGSHGKLLTIAPEDGSTVAENDVPKDIYITPVVASNAMYLLANDGTLLAIR